MEDFLDLGQHKTAFYQCFRYALSSVDSEVCGFFYLDNINQPLQFQPLLNENLIDKNTFSTSDPTFYNLYKLGKIICLFHTHLSQDDPSVLDLETSNSFNLPSFIINIESNKSFLYYPTDYKPKKIKNRVFIPYFQDCIIYVKDYLQKYFDINLNGQLINWSRNGKNSLNMLNYYADKHFYNVNKQDFKNGDVIIFKPDVSIYPHVGIVNHDLYCFHHPVYQYPAKEFISSDFLNQVYKVYRYKDL